MPGLGLRFYGCGVTGFDTWCQASQSGKDMAAAKLSSDACSCTNSPCRKSWLESNQPQPPGGSQAGASGVAAPELGLKKSVREFTDGPCQMQVTIVFGPARNRHRHEDGARWALLWGPTQSTDGTDRTDRATQPKGRTPIQAPCAQNANPAQATKPTTRHTRVGARRPAG
jgi:hypothetical protein